MENCDQACDLKTTVRRLGPGTTISFDAAAAVALQIERHVGIADFFSSSATRAEIPSASNFGNSFGPTSMRARFVFVQFVMADAHRKPRSRRTYSPSSIMRSFSGVTSFAVRDAN